MASVVVKTFVFLFLIFTFSNSGGADGLSLKEGLKQPSPCGQVIVKTKVARKLLGMETLLDYHDPIANSSHEPRKGNKNP